MNALRAATIVLLPTLILATVVITGTARPLQASANALPTVHAAGIMVNYAVDEQESGMPALAFQGTFAQTKLALVVDSPEGGIIGFSRKSSKVTSFADSTGRSLLQGDATFGPFAFGERIVQDGKRLVVTLETEKAPAAGAGSIEATGTIDVTIAHETKTYTSQTAPVERGHGLRAGPILLTIQEYEKSSWNDDMELTLETKWNVDAITSYTAVLADGSRVALSRSSTMTFNGTTNVTLTSKVDLGDAFALEVEAWDQPKQRTVPFQVKANAGLK